MSQKKPNWCDTSIGLIRKENKNVPDRVWNRFMNIDEERISLWSKIILLWQQLSKKGGRENR